MSEASIAPLPAGMSPAVLPGRHRSGEERGRESENDADPGADARRHPQPDSVASARSLPEAEESPVDAATLFAATLLGNALGPADRARPTRSADEWDVPPSETRITDRKV